MIETYNILLISPRNLHPGIQPPRTPLLNPRPALLAIMTDIPHGLHTSAITDFPVLDLGTHRHHDTSTLMARGEDTEVLHLLGEGQVVEHVVDVGHAEAGDVEAEEEFRGAGAGDVDVVDFEVEVWPGVDDDACFAIFRDLWVCHGDVLNSRIDFDDCRWLM